jgi:hypothetical protein
MSSTHTARNPRARRRSPIGFLRASAFALLGLGGLAAHAAGWQLDAANSSVGFATVKNDVVGEGHAFGRLSGSIDAKGVAHLKIDLASVDTGIPIRDERMRDLLFEVARFPVAEISATVPLAEIEPLPVGASILLPLELTLKLHGAETTLAASLRVRRLDAGHVLVTTVKPVVVSAAEVGLGEAIERLREIAGLQSISPAVPVSVVLAFRRP